MISETPIDFGDLLPRPDESAACADWAKHVDIKPIGTALSVDQVLLIEVPLPWPKPVGAHVILEPVMALAEQGQIPTRILASVPRGYVAGIRVTSYVRVADGADRRVFELPSVLDLAELVASLVQVDGSAPPPEPVAETNPPEQAVLVCTQGSHDVCCGSQGTRFARDVEEAFPQVEVHRVSHTGGHRFAPTAMTLPDGRMWAWLNVEIMENILSMSGTPADVGAHCRGWWGASRGAGQAAEQAVLEERGWAWSLGPRTVTVQPAADGSSHCVVDSPGHTAKVQVEIAREVPSIACRAPGGLPAKPGRDYAARVLP